MKLFMKTTKKAFREYLNQLCEDENKWKNGRYCQKKRGYGDYLYYQDREQFEVQYKKWLEENNQLNSKIQ